MRHDLATEPGGPRRDRPCAYTTQNEVTTRLYLQQEQTIAGVRSRLSAAGASGRSLSASTPICFQAGRHKKTHMESAIVLHADM
eukprot:scaffold132088_cov33-Tisochrysis_lutea.AAC.1